MLLAPFSTSSFLITCKGYTYSGSPTIKTSLLKPSVHCLSRHNCSSGCCEVRRQLPCSAKAVPSCPYCQIPVLSLCCDSWSSLPWSSGYIFCLYKLLPHPGNNRTMHIKPSGHICLRLSSFHSPYRPPTQGVCQACSLCHTVPECLHSEC